MIVNQASLKGLNVGYSAAYNKSFEGVEKSYEKIATTVPSTTAETRYTWLGQFPQMREWIGEREIQNISAYDYSIKNKKFEMSVSVQTTSTAHIPRCSPTWARQRRATRTRCASAR